MTDPGSTTPAPGTPRDRDRRRAMLQATLERWLQGRGSTDPAAQARAALVSLGQWPGVAADPRRHGLDQVLAFLRAAAPEGTGSLPASAAPLAPAFARVLVAQAVADVEFEATRAGHGGTFAGLRPWLEHPPAPHDLPDLARSLGLPEAALATALRRLRRRFRQRIDAGLALWSASPEQREVLRREMHAALSTKELSP